MGTMTRGPLPKSVYWRRRLVLLGIVGILIVAGFQLLRPGGDDEPDAASPVAAEPQPTVTVTASPKASDDASADASGATLPEPEGACDPADITIEPAVEDSPAYDEVGIQLRLRTVKTPACTWELKPRDVQVRLTKKGRMMWSSVDCPSAVPRERVTLYQQSATILSMTWNGHRSDAKLCGDAAAWAPSGNYKVAAAVLGGEPAGASFALLPPGSEPSDAADESSESASADASESESAPTEGPTPGARDEPTDLPD